MWPSRVDDVAVRPVSLEDAAHVADVMGEAGDDEVRVVVRGRVGEQRAALEDIVARQGDEHGMLDIVVKGVAVADAFEREPRREWNDLGEPRVRDPEPVSDVVRQIRAKRFGREPRHRDHHGSLRRSPRRTLAIDAVGRVRARLGLDMPGSP